MNNPELAFSQATREDLDYLTQKTIQLHQFESANGKAELQVNDKFEDNIRHWLSLELANDSSLIFTVSDNQQRIGFAFLKILPNPNNFTEYRSFGLIQTIWVDDEFRQKKAGASIVSFIESIFKEQQVSYYEVNYSAQNELAGKFWESCGLVPTSITARKFLD
ncbi:GNAT family N-acetyltransferase [Aliikangiella marina]|nr:GNAT family N-acetyltransferase [Aliikangiella marina]